MVHDLFETTGAGEDELIFKFASDINIDQATEIARMQRMLFMMSVAGPSRPDVAVIAIVTTSTSAPLHTPLQKDFNNGIPYRAGLRMRRSTAGGPANGVVRRRRAGAAACAHPNASTGNLSPSNPANKRTLPADLRGR